MASVKNRRFVPGERFGALPVEVMDSDAFRWIPNFAIRVLVVLAGRYSGHNNGGLELALNEATRFGIKRPELYAGLKLLVHAGLIRKTVKERKSSGRGVPAKYALTWKPTDEFPAYNLRANERPTNNWAKFREDTRQIRSVSEAERFLGWRKPLPRSIEAYVTPRTKTSE